MYQHQIAVFDLGREHAELRLDVRARVIVCNNEFAVGCTGFLRERVIASERKDIKIAVQTADERAVIVRHDDVSLALRENVVQFFVRFLRKVDSV